MSKKCDEGIENDGKINEEIRRMTVSQENTTEKQVGTIIVTTVYLCVTIARCTWG